MNSKINRMFMMIYCINNTILLLYLVLYLTKHSDMHPIGKFTGLQVMTKDEPRIELGQPSNLYKRYQRIFY